MRWLYDIGIRFFWLSIVLGSAWNGKAKLWVNGRKGWHEMLLKQFKKDDHVIWFHCASLGEFEQGRPIIEETRKKARNVKILLTFSSPSGYEKRKNYDQVNYVCYLPLDTAKNAKKFIEAVPLKAVFFIKYEFWYHYLQVLHRQSIPVFLASAKFRPEQIFFKWYGGWYRNFLNYFNHMFVQGEQSKTLLESHGSTEVTVAGDTRFDRVAKVVQTEYRNNALEKFSEGANVIIAGSTWEGDEDLLLHAYKELAPDYKWIIAPHELSVPHIKRLQNTFENCVLFTETGSVLPPGTRVVIVDTIGQLSFLYRYGTIAYIGGGFGKGIHNILEAATYGLPVIFGPHFHKFSEAVELVDLGGAFPVHNEDELLSTIHQQFNSGELLKTSSETCRNYVQSKVGATSLIMEIVCIKTGMDML